MKKLLGGLAAGLMLFGLAGNASATSITVEKVGTPLTLAHSNAYMWGVQSSTWDSLVNPITAASITITQIWDNSNSGFENDQLALFLLDEAKMTSSTATWYSLYDGSVIDPRGPATNSLAYADNNSNLFSAITPLVTYYVTEDIKNIRTQKVDLVYNFTDADLSMLQGYLATSTSGVRYANRYRDIALGLDPDCHFELAGIKFTVSDDPAPIPEPATMLLLGTGLAGLIGIRRKRKA